MSLENETITSSYFFNIRLVKFNLLILIKNRIKLVLFNE